MDMLTLEDVQQFDWVGSLAKTGFVVLLLIVAYCLVALAWRVLGIVHLVRRKTVLLEITPLAFSDKTLQATESLFVALYGLGMSRTFTERLFNKRIAFVTSIRSNKSGGIRFSIECPKEHTETVVSLIYSYLPDAKVVASKPDALLDATLKNRIFEFKQTRPYALPFKSYDQLIDRDPVGYLTSAMSKLDDNEQIIYQIVIAPERVRNAKRINKKLLRNDAVLATLIEGKSVGAPILGLISTVCLGMIDLVSTIADNGQSRRYVTQSKTRELEHRRGAAQGMHPSRMISTFEREDIEPVHNKLSSPLFRTAVRVYVESGSKDTIRSKRAAISSALSLYATKYQSLVLKRRKFLLGERVLSWQFTKGLPDIAGSPMYLSSAELAALWHFPNSQSAKSENIVKSLSKTLEAPLALKNGTKLDILFGENRHQGVSTPIGLTFDERQRHMLVIGGTGNGKTTLMKYQIVQDIQAGKGVAVIDPHGDLAEELLRYIPEGRIKDVIYFNPDDRSYPIGVNLIELPQGVSGDSLLSAKDFVADMIVSLMRKTFSNDGTGGHRIERHLRNAALTAMTVEDSTIFTILDLLTDKDYRKPIVEALEQDWLKRYWQKEFGRGSAWQQVKAMGGVTDKIDRYHASAAAERVLSQPKSTINFDEILDGKILICNLAKGLIGEDTSEVLGIAVLTQLQLAAYRRIRKPQSERKPFFVYVDEFQNFATISFTEMLSEARKYKLFLTMAEQSTQQQSDEQLTNIILNNVGTLVSFRTGSPADEQLLRPYLGERYIDRGGLVALPAYNFYARIVSDVPQEPLSGMTMLLKDNGSELIAGRVKESSRALYATKYVEPAPMPQPTTETNTKQQTYPTKRRSQQTSKKQHYTPRKKK